MPAFQQLLRNTTPGPVLPPAAHGGCVGRVLHAAHDMPAPRRRVTGAPMHDVPRALQAARIGVAWQSPTSGPPR